jgi:hypothetical protein
MLKTKHKGTEIKLPRLAFDVVDRKIKAAGAV